jgi:hypothetical protein
MDSAIALCAVPIFDLVLKIISLNKLDLMYILIYSVGYSGLFIMLYYELKGMDPVLLPYTMQIILSRGTQCNASH